MSFLEKASNVLASLGRSETVALAGFLAGVGWLVFRKNKKGGAHLLEHPFIFFPSVCAYASLTSCGAILGSTMMPREVRCIIPLTLAASVAYCAVTNKCDDE
jgi:predicted membrane-bound mannosyltransferase